MISRPYAAGLVTIIGLGLILAPNETFGRSGVGRSTLRASIHASPPALRTQLHRHRFGFGVPLIMPDGAFPYDYEPSDYVDPYDRASSADPDMATDAIPDGVNPVVVRRIGCRSQTMTVPSETGGERSINIVRC
jgi:hypothetical protein